ncbi:MULTISPECIES: DUF2599 domain-containing protein [Bacillus cereus group]|uniref:DUF2599 domain-containing protein n=1 Tax=Bacillus cereus group TaxID=86661 RepID=UPI0010BF1E7C|nr:DUF2599 domain-containing protein [Bacillus cereus]MCU4842078.1 DUF2599 domain-containing protein [Bacillus cereus]MCU5270931.1 DUF2599 domain-containing protein [Bacillus cereus]TKH69680.1 DUF2599 domain-containing protein [Bacillus cereus]
MNDRLKKLIISGILAGIVFSITNIASANSTDISEETTYTNAMSSDYTKDNLTFSTANGEIIKIGHLQSINPTKNNFYFFSNKKDSLPNFKKVKNGVEQSIKIDPTKNNGKYKVPFDFENGESIKVEEDGSAVIYNKNKESIAVVMPTEAKSQSGEILEVHTTLKNENTLEYYVNIKEEVNPITIKNTATSYAFSQYFSSGNWITRDGMVSLSLEPTSVLTKLIVNRAIRTDSWNKVKDTFSMDDQWGNTSSMQNQYLCHYDFAKSFKTPWNLEPHRPDVGYLKTVAATCNP